ncbi:hypothetical protein Glove_115g13 [Diversispora epigaea]|uniref:Uncharacterized protein n=1 Tax=Diversispora epigaea TaxID=1348612 RepID=A0A397J3M3_9GLOM|nr:hypothetical protein Glove_115g13 [Diversispora epigaea]
MRETLLDMMVPVSGRHFYMKYLKRLQQESWIHLLKIKDIVTIGLHSAVTKHEITNNNLDNNNCIFILQMQKADLEDMTCTITLIHISSKAAMPLSKISLRRVQVAKCNSINQLLGRLQVELETKNAELLKQVREAENAKLKARIAKLKQIAEENTELKDRITKLEQKQTQVINKQEPSPTKDISSLIESHSDEEKGITPEIEHSSIQSESETSTTSLPQDIIDDDSAEILDFVEAIHKERISSEIRERNREKKLQKSHNNLTPPMQSIVLTPESLDSKTVKNFWNQNQNKSQDKTSQSHKKKGTENIVQVIADGIQDNILSDPNHVIEISVTARHQNSDTISLLDLTQLFDKATNAEHYVMKANQEETLC